jgi:hypothetical protein
LFARFSNAETVFVGGGPSGSVVNLNRFPQGLPSPATPPAELTQGATTSPRVSMTSVGTVYPLGTFKPGDTPVLGLTSSEARLNAVSKEALFCGLDPTAI